MEAPPPAARPCYHHRVWNGRESRPAAERALPRSAIAVRPAEASDQFACILLDPSYLAERVWQVNRQQTGEELLVQIRPLRLPRPRHVESERDVPAFLATWNAATTRLVADRAGTVIGWLAAQADPANGVCHLLDCVISAPLRRRGIGSRLLAACLESAANGGSRALRARVPTYNDPAIRWLARAGARIAGWDEPESGGPPALLLTRPVRAAPRSPG